MEETASSPCIAVCHMEAGKRGLKRGLESRKRTVILMLDETIVTEPPPLSQAYSHVGFQARVPISGVRRTKRIIHGAINVATGDIALLITKEWNQITHQDFLGHLRSRWRGWHIVLFEDRGSPHTTEETRTLAIQLGIEIRLLPVSTPELNPMDHLWRHAKRQAVANRAMPSGDGPALRICRYIIGLSPKARLRQAGILSGAFWLTT